MRITRNSRRKLGYSPVVHTLIDVLPRGICTRRDPDRVRESQKPKAGFKSIQRAEGSKKKVRERENTEQSENAGGGAVAGRGGI